MVRLGRVKIRQYIPCPQLWACGLVRRFEPFFKNQLFCYFPASFDSRAVHNNGFTQRLADSSRRLRIHIFTLFYGFTDSNGFTDSPKFFFFLRATDSNGFTDSTKFYFLFLADSTDSRILLLESNGVDSVRIH